MGKHRSVLMGCAILIAMGHTVLKLIQPSHQQYHQTDPYAKHIKTNP